MAHTTSKVNFGTKFAVAIVAFTSYTVGGETFTLAEFGLTGPILGVWFLSTNGDGDPSQYCKYIGGGIIQVFSVARPDQEQPTGAVAFTILAVIQGS